jgi:hypothetical protein
VGKARPDNNATLVLSIARKRRTLNDEHQTCSKLQARAEIEFVTLEPPANSEVVDPTHVKIEVTLT